MTTLLLDVGNTLVKWKLLGSDGRLSGVDDSTSVTECIKDILLRIPEVDRAVISWVGANDARRGVADLFFQHGAQTHWVSTASSFNGLRNGYSTAAALGVDRWLAMMAAWKKFEGQGFVVVDAGTALTVDIVSCCGAHLGGFILPGLKTMTDSLVSGTAGINVTLGRSCSPPWIPGQCTEDAVGQGARLALTGALNDLLAKKHDLVASKRLISGGDGQHLLPFLDGEWEYMPEIVLAGLELVLS